MALFEVCSGYPMVRSHPAGPGPNLFCRPSARCMCDVFSPNLVGGTLVNTAAYCGASNSQFVVTATDIKLKDPQVRVSNPGGVAI